MSAVIDSNVWEERRRDVELMQLDERRMVEYHDWLAHFEDGSASLGDLLTPDEGLDMLAEVEALVVEALRKKLPLPDVSGILIDMIREAWDKEALLKAGEVD